MAAEYKARGRMLLDRLQEIYSEYGYYYDALDSYTLEGKDGLERIQSIMNNLRSGSAPFGNVKAVVDYSEPQEQKFGFGRLPSADVLKYTLEDGSWIAVRPSGTEPKIKIYYSVVGENEAKAREKFATYQANIIAATGLN